jgi:hypothetical protein
LRTYTTVAAAHYEHYHEKRAALMRAKKRQAEIDQIATKVAGLQARLTELQEKNREESVSIVEPDDSRYPQFAAAGM